MHEGVINGEERHVIDGGAIGAAKEEQVARPFLPGIDRLAVTRLIP